MRGVGSYVYSEISGKRVHPGPEHLSIYLSIDLVHWRRHHACITSGEGTQKKGVFTLVPSEYRARALCLFERCLILDTYDTLIP